MLIDSELITLRVLSGRSAKKSRIWSTLPISALENCRQHLLIFADSSIMASLLKGQSCFSRHACSKPGRLWSERASLYCARRSDRSSKVIADRMWSFVKGPSKFSTIPQQGARKLFIYAQKRASIIHYFVDAVHTGLPCWSDKCLGTRQYLVAVCTFINKNMEDCTVCISMKYRLESDHLKESGFRSFTLKLTKYFFLFDCIKCFLISKDSSIIQGSSPQTIPVFVLFNSLYLW